MSRIRSIKPEFWTSSQVVACSRDARLLFMGMWNFCDDAGRHSADVGMLKREVLAGDGLTDKRVAKWVQELIDVGLLLPYVVGTKRLWQVTGWHHQYIQRPQPPRYPAPDSDTSTVPLREPSVTDTKRYDPKGTEGNLRSFDRSIDTFFLSDGGEENLDWGAVKDRCRFLLNAIHAVWDGNLYSGREVVGRDPWPVPIPFREKLVHAAACVEAGILPAAWLDGVVALMLDGGKRKDKNPAGWLGKVLAERAREDHGVDWDSYRRAIKIPEKFFEAKGGEA